MLEQNKINKQQMLFQYLFSSHCGMLWYESPKKAVRMQPPLPYSAADLLMVLYA